MKKLNAKELTEEFNKLRQKEMGKTYLGLELDKLLQRYGFNKALIYTMKKSNVFMSISSGTSKLYQFRDTPLFIDKMGEIIRDYRKSLKKKEEVQEEQSPEEAAMSLLKSKGYQIKVCRGFNEELFKKENPDLYSKYLIYEYV